MSINKSLSKHSIALDLSNHNLNNSSSKQKFSFPKASRFGNYTSLCDSFYQIPSMRNGRATSFGYGNKDMGISKSNKNFPQPATYNIQSQFNKRKRGTSFGFGRQQMKQGGHLRDSIARRLYPGPGNYKTYQTIQRIGATLKSRLPDTTLQPLKKIPGPGTYGYEQIGRKNYYVNSRHPNLTGAAKMTQKSQRYKGLYKSTALGPGQYNINQSDIKPFGKYILSQDRGSQSKVFSKSPRGSIVQKHLLQNPGPSYYSPFRYFGPG